ncbi:DUF1178 family protein [Altererythrobacter salegens]|uniref:DUF1178 family protein n=1 Tax=Croceibacterium salegens TaxID=1737568 RepID=A0A6I4SUH2_9SPHN|nr:DUF1178 family protein [Croceibacterium salegens]MXO59615.1 DUF1178 family protein [Croceibacterium salegens]
MIVFDLTCGEGHNFEGWFGSSDDFAAQQARGLVSCPQCGSVEVAKAPMAPAVPKKGNQQAASQPSAHVAGGKLPPEAISMLEQIARMQAESLKTSIWVGDGFAEQSREMHYGEREAEAIHGKATPEEARALAEEGVPVMPILIPFAPPDELN